MQMPAFQLALQLGTAPGLSGRNLIIVIVFVTWWEQDMIPLGGCSILFLHFNSHGACGESDQESM